MKGGYITLSRKFFENTLWKEPREYSRAEAWLDMISMARFDSSVVMLNSRAIEVQKGEIAISRRYLEKRWGWGSTKVNNFLVMLKTNQMITQRQTNGQTIVTLCNYEVYNNTQTTSQTTNKPDGEPLQYQETGSSTGSQDTVPPPKLDIDYDKLVDHFNTETKGIFGTLRTPLSEARKKMIRARCATHGKDAFVEVIKIAMDSPFLCGQNSRSWAMTFDWMIKPANFEKILSGNYDNKTLQNETTSANRQYNGTPQASRGVSAESLASAIEQGIGRARYNKQQREVSSSQNE
ncbi:MAG: hypothetical protein SNH27_17880 [Rikenellaceae bacterium]